MTRWSVGVEAEADRVLTHDEIVGLADAVAGSGGIATGMGTTSYGAQLVVDTSREEAESKGREEFRTAARAAGLPEAPIIRCEATSEDEEF